MAKKKSTTSGAAAAVEAVPVEADSSAAATAGGGDETTIDDDDVDVDELELLQIDLGDMIKLKQVLDESVAGAVLEVLPEDYVWDNLKLGIMFVACLFAMIAQFAPIPFPESRPVLGLCGSAYFALSGVLQLIATFIDRDTILWTQPVTEKSMKEKGRTLKNKDMMKYGLKVRSSLPRFSEFYTVTIEFQMKDNKNPPFVQQKWSVGQFFDKEGYFDEVGLTMEIDKLLDRFDEGKFDRPEDKKKKE